VAAVRERIASFDNSARDHVLLAELDGQVAGVLASSLTPRFAEPGMFSRITALAIDPSVQRGGSGVVWPPRQNASLLRTGAPRCR
jgi:hypothetical protein